MWQSKELFLFSGLGADERIFQNLNFKNNNATYIKWIDPLNNETIENYALRISKQITAENSILIGVLTLLVFSEASQTTNVSPIAYIN